MRKVLIALAAFAAFSCSTDVMIDAPKDAAIEFSNLFVENSTRAAVDITKDNIENFGVFGWVESDDKQGQIFSNTTVYKQDGKFIYDTPQYWIGGAQYYFAALAPKKGAAWTYTPAQNDALYGTIFFDNDAANAEQDVVFDFVTPERTPENITSKPSAVAFNFRHILSRVKFSFKNGFAASSNISLDVNSVVIKNAYANGTIDVAEGVLAQNWNPAGNMEVVFGDSTIENSTQSTIYPGDTAKTVHLYLIPGSKTYNVEFKITLYQAGIELAHYSRTATVTVNMERGKSYELKATLNQNNTADHGELSPIEFTVGNIDGWNGENTNL